MPVTSLDFALIRRTARFDAVLSHYGLRVIGRGDQRFISCPFHDEKTPSCSVNYGKRIFHCFGCGAKGTIIDFVAKMERIPLREAAAKLVKWCGRSASGGSQAVQDPATLGPGGDTVLCNPPIKEPLALDPDHPYLAARGLSREAIAEFGLGFRSNGWMRGRICIPIHDDAGNLVAYAGRWANDPVPTGLPRYVLSRGFRKRCVLFGLNRLPDTDHIVLVEGYWSVIRLHGLRLPGACLMGRSMSEEQLELLKQRHIRSILLMMDRDEPGRCAREQLAIKLTHSFYVRAPELGNGEKPDTIAQARLIELASV